MLVGGVYRRPGTVNVTALPVATDHPPRLFPFIDSINQAYVLAFGQTVGGATYVKPYRAATDGSVAVGGTTLGTCTGVHPYTIQDYTAAVANFGAGGGSASADNEVHQAQFCQSVDNLYLTHPNHKPQIVSRTAKDTFIIRDFDKDVTGTRLTGDDFANAYPYLNQNTTSTNLKISNVAIGSGRTLTASTPIFTAAHVGSVFRMDDTTTKIGCCVVTAFVDTSNVTVDVIQTFGTTSYESLWWESAWSPRFGWPRSCAIFEQRLVMSGTKHQPDTNWFSETANYQRFAHLNLPTPPPTILPTGQTITASGTYVRYPVDDAQGDGASTGPIGSQAFRITLSQNQIDQVQWLSPDKELLVGTQSQEWIISPQNGDFSVGNSPTVLQSKYGSDYLQAQRIGYELIFPLNTCDEVRAYQYNYIDASFFAEPVQLMFDQYPAPEIKGIFMGRKKIRWMQWDVTRQTLWCIDTRGNFYGMTRDRKLQTTMWHTHQLGGFDTTKGVNAGAGSGGTQFVDPAWTSCDGSVVSFTLSANPQSTINDIWMVVKRTINGAAQWQIERAIGKTTPRESAYSGIVPMFGVEPVLVDGAYLNNDAGNPATLTYTVGAGFEGLSLVGTYYSATYGIFKLTTGPVVAGVATINSTLPPDYGTATNVVVLGIPFYPVVQPVKPEVGSQMGTAQSAPMRLHRCFIRFYKTMSALVGMPPTNAQSSGVFEEMDFTSATTPLGKSREIFTGVKEVYPPTTYDRDSQLYITQDEPLPFAITSIVMEGQEYD